MVMPLGQIEMRIRHIAVSESNDKTCTAMFQLRGRTGKSILTHLESSPQRQQ